MAMQKIIMIVRIGGTSVSSSFLSSSSASSPSKGRVPRILIERLCVRHLVTLFCHNFHSSKGAKIYSLEISTFKGTLKCLKIFVRSMPYGKARTLVVEWRLVMG